MLGIEHLLAEVDFIPYISKKIRRISKKNTAYTPYVSRNNLGLMLRVGNPLSDSSLPCEQIFATRQGEAGEDKE